MKIFGYYLINEEEYKGLKQCEMASVRAANMQRWLNPWREVFEPLFKHIFLGNDYPLSVREKILIGMKKHKSNENEASSVGIDKNESQKRE